MKKININAARSKAFIFEPDLEVGTALCSTAARLSPFHPQDLVIEGGGFIHMTSRVKIIRAHF